MSKVKEAADAAIELKNRLVGLIDSGELSVDQREAASTALVYTGKAADEIEGIIDAEVFPYITCGEFMMHGGVIDVGVDKIKIQWGMKQEDSVTAQGSADMFDKILNYIGNYARFGPASIMMLEAVANESTDEVRFSYAVETDRDMHAPAPYNGISLITPAGAKREHGVFYQGKAYFRNPDLRSIPVGVYEHKLYGYAFPNNIEDPGRYIPLIRSSAASGGEFADLRAFSPVFRNDIDELVDYLKEMRWKKIYTQWKRYILLASGDYRTW